MTSTESRRAVGLKAAAEMFGVSQKTLTRAVRAGELRARKTAVGGIWTFKVADLDDWHDSLPDA